MTTYHWHHIVPRHAGGTDNPENLLKVTVEEHAELHFARYLQHGEMGDWMAYHALSGQIDTQEVILQKASLGGQVTTSRYPEKLAEWGKKGGSSRSDRKEKSSQTNLALSRKEKSVLLIDSDGNEFSFSSVKEAASQKRLHRPNLSLVLLGKRKTVGGFTARYLS